VLFEWLFLPLPGIFAVHENLLDVFMQRQLTFGSFVLLAVLLGLARPPLILFGVKNLAGALWTWLTLRATK
jgi:hypothetical protein